MAAETWPPVDHVPPLGADDIHVWRVGLERDGLEIFLSQAELERANRFRFPHLQRRYIAGRGTLRRLLGEYLGIPPAEIALETTSLGKPRLVGEPADGLRFNIAHSEDLALMAFARGREVGVDLEHQRQNVDYRELAERYFAAEEIAALMAMPSADRRHAFYRCWTRKEAYVKALGFGMQVPLDGFAVTIAADEARLLHTAHDPIQNDRWELRGLSPAAEFAAALAVEGHNWRQFSAGWTGFP